MMHEIMMMDEEVLSFALYCTADTVHVGHEVFSMNSCRLTSGIRDRRRVRTWNELDRSVGSG